MLLQYDAATENAIGALLPGLRGSYPLSSRAVALLLLAGDDEIASLVRAREGEREKVVLVARAEVAHGGVDPPALLRDVEVAQARGAEFLFLVPGLAEDGVGVRVHEAGGEDPAIAVHARGVPELPLELRLRPNGGDAVTLDGDGGVGEDLRVEELRAAAGTRRAGAGDDLSRVDEERGHRA